MTMNTKFESTLNIISFLTLSITVFGILMMGAFVAPTVFSEITPRPIAADLMTNIFSKYYSVALICISITTIIEIIRFIMSKKIVLSSKVWLIQFSIIAVIFVIIGYTNISIYPQIVEMRAEQKGPTLWTNPDFVILHKKAEFLGKLTFMIGLIPLSLMVTVKSKRV